MIVPFYRWVYEHARGGAIVFALGAMLFVPTFIVGQVIDLVGEDRGWPEYLGYPVALAAVSLLAGRALAKQRFDEIRDREARRALREDYPDHLGTMVGLRGAIQRAVRDVLPAGARADVDVKVVGAEAVGFSLIVPPREGQ